MAKTLDARGLACPMPIVRTKKVMDQLADGEELIVLATDPGSVADFKAWTRRMGHDLLSIDEADREYRFRILKRSPKIEEGD